MGYSSKWPKALRYGTHQYCSIKIQHYRFEQLIKKVDVLHRFINNSDYQNLVTIMIDLFQLANGI